MDTKRYLVVLVVLAVCTCFATTGCKSSSSNQPTLAQYSHALSVIATYLYSGTPESGTVEVTMNGSGQKFTGTIGETITLAKTTNQSEPCDILIKADGALPREYTAVGVTNTDLTTNVAETAKLDVTGLLANVMFGGRNAFWTPHVINVIFNPDPNGVRLPQDHVDEIVRAINNIKAWSGGYIQSVAFDNNGNKTVDATVPPDGELWVFKVSDSSGVANAPYPSEGNKVTSSKIFINQSSSLPAMTYNETFDAFIQSEQTALGGYASIAQWFQFMMNRPRDTNSYVLSQGKETQVGIDTLTTTRTYAQTKTRAVPDPSSPLGGIIGPQGSIIESVSPTKDVPLRPGSERGTKERIR